MEALFVLRLFSRRFVQATAQYDVLLAPVFNVTGQPAVSLPLYWTAAGPPIGSMLVGRPADEATLVSLAAQVEAARPWARRHPDAWDWAG